MKKVFVVGCARSGTTLVQSLIGAREDFYTCKETHYFQMIRRPGRRAFLDRFGLRMANVKKARDFILSNNQLLEEYDFEGVDSLASATELFDVLMTKEAQAREKSGWVEKTPGHLFHISLIKRYIPSALFVHVIRDGRDVVASMVEASRRFPEASAWKAHSDLDVAIGRYNRCFKESIQYFGAAGHVIVGYEHILDDVASTVNQLFTELGLEGRYEDLNLDGAGVHETVKRADEDWKSNSIREIKDTRLVKFNQIFSEEQKKRICERTMTLPSELTDKLV